VNHYCTYFDHRYAVQGLALWRSLQRHDAGAVLWVLCLDDVAFRAIERISESHLRPVALSELETTDPALAVARANRSWVEYVFTLSPCWPRFLLEREPTIAVITYVDADMAFFSSPEPLFSELGAGSVLIVEHRFPHFLQHLAERGRFNVGVQCFRNDSVGRACLDDWRLRCLEWCYDRVEPERYADQKYLDAWPQRFAGIVASANPGVNLAPWNWMNHRYEFGGDTLFVDGRPLLIFHFARLRPRGRFRFDSGQLEYGVMPLRLRSWIYGRYADLLDEARAQILAIAPDLVVLPVVARGKRAAWRTQLLETLFGSVWWRVGPWMLSPRFSLGRHSGRLLTWFRGTARRRVTS
jgi:hypothetical protein